MVVILVEALQLNIHQTDAGTRVLDSVHIFVVHRAKRADSTGDRGTCPPQFLYASELDPIRPPPRERERERERERICAISALFAASHYCSTEQK